MTTVTGTSFGNRRVALGALVVAAVALVAACATTPPVPPVPPKVIPIDRCEECHNSTPHPGCDGIPGTADDAPNVMGNGKLAAGTGTAPKPYDDGTFGFNVNGHGANGSAGRSPQVSFDPNVGCTACHDVSSPTPGTHFDCGTKDVNRKLNTLNWAGKPADTRNANTAHLVAGYLPEAPTPRERQVAFDDYCFNACHRGADVADMRHSSRVNGVPDKVMEFSIANDTTDDPKQDRGLDRRWTPWTIDDLTAAADADPPRIRHYGTCVSCHDPHGTETLQKTRGTNRMVLRNWQDTSMPSFCGNACHRTP